jgi:hypothetical protein
MFLPSGFLTKILLGTSNQIKTISNDKGDEDKQNKFILNFYTKHLNSGTVVRQRTIPTKRPPLVGEVSANFT